MKLSCLFKVISRQFFIAGQTSRRMSEFPVFLFMFMGSWTVYQCQ